MRRTKTNPGTRDAGAERIEEQRPSSYQIANEVSTARSARRRSELRQIEIVHHCSNIGVYSWRAVLFEYGERRIVATFTSKSAAIAQLEFLSKKFRARIVGRGSTVINRRQRKTRQERVAERAAKRAAKLGIEVLP